ncbi:MgtC/SapB family protein [Halobacteriovorax sp. GFR7]|uniref:MgtC/SapB family protein n=1 Tax=unclassified Halobacteriovorax TaxID=2639665 RepID=UPI00370FFEDE
MYIEFIGEQPVYISMGIKVVSSIILGGFIGYDREQKMKSAGIKTNMLICLGAATYTSLSVLTMSEHMGTVADPNRMAAQIVSGIGFLGAGAIIQGRGNVVGMTTAATVWVVAAIGMTVGFGYPVIAALITISLFAVLRLINPVYRMLESDKAKQNFYIEVLSNGRIRGHVKEILYSRVEDIEIVSEEVLDAVSDERLLTLNVQLHPRWVAPIKREIKTLIRVNKVEFHQRDRDIL